MSATKFGACQVVAGIDARELASLQAIARMLLEMKPRQLELAVEAGELMEIEL